MHYLTNSVNNLTNSVNKQSYKGRKTRQEQKIVLTNPFNPKSAMTLLCFCINSTSYTQQ